MGLPGMFLAGPTGGVRMDLRFWKKKAGGDGREDQDAKIRNVCIWFGFILAALSFMWASTMHDAYKASRSSLEAAYGARIEAAARGPVNIDMYDFGNLPGTDADDDQDEVNLHEGISDVAALQNRFVEVAAAGFADFDAYEADVQEVWDGMEEWFPNDGSHSWYRWDMDKTNASWSGYLSSDKAGRAMGIWTCLTRDGTLLAYSLAWYGGGHKFGNLVTRTTPAGYELLPEQEYHDTLSGTYELAPGDSDMSDDRTLDDHVDSALTILDGLGLTHGWYDSMIRDQEGGGQDAGQEEAVGQGPGTEPGPGEAGGQ